MLVDAPCEGIQFGAVEGFVVFDPAPDLRIDVLSETGQARPGATTEVPGPDLLAFPLRRLGTDGRREAHEEPLWTTGLTSLEGVAEEVEAGVLRLPRWVHVLAEHDPGLVGVQFETQGSEPLGDGCPQGMGLFLGVAVGNDGICVALEGAARILSDYPTIERIVHEQVGQ